MIVFLIKRLANAALVMLVVAAMAFLIFRFVGDPVQLMVNEQTTQAEKDALREGLGLNDPVIVQFFRFVGNAVQGDFGVSYRNQQEVMSLIAERFPATIELLDRLGYRVVPTGTAEIGRIDAGLSCMSLRWQRPPP